MQIVLVSVGKLKAGADRELFDRYWDRLQASGKAAGITRVRLVELPESKAGSADARKSDEVRRILKAIGDDAFLIALDETGVHKSSETFAAEIRALAERGVAEVAFVIGGADGHGPGVRARAQAVLSLGRMTMPHGLARIVLAEQLYRAVTILTGHPYHRS